MNTAELTAFAAGKRALDVGCGKDKIPGSIGIDFAAAADSDIHHDLGVFPYPIDDNRFDVIFCRNVVEHVPDIVRLMEELHRIGRRGADVLITTPHFSSLYAYQDPTHVRHLAYESFDYFSDRTRHANFYTRCRFEILERRIDFGKSFPYSLIAKAIAAASVRHYERHFAFIFPANSLFFRLRIQK